MILTIYLIGFVLMFTGGLYYLREEVSEPNAGHVFAILLYSLIWFVSIPMVIIYLLLEQVAKLITKDKK